MAEEVERLGSTLEAVLPEALQGVYRERQKKQTAAKSAVTRAKKAVGRAKDAVAAAGQTTALPAVLVPPDQMLRSVRTTYLELLREGAVIQAVREALTDPKNRNLPALLRSVMEFVGGEEKPTDTVNVTLVSRIPRPEKAIDITPGGK